MATHKHRSTLQAHKFHEIFNYLRKLKENQKSFIHSESLIDSTLKIGKCGEIISCLHILPWHVKPLKRERKNSERSINEGKILRSLFVVVSFCLFSTGPIQIRKTTCMRHSFYFSHQRENRPQETHSIVIGYKGVECVCQRHDYFPHQKKKEFCSLLLRKLNECVCVYNFSSLHRSFVQTIQFKVFC